MRQRSRLAQLGDAGTSATPLTTIAATGAAAAAAAPAGASDAASSSLPAIVPLQLQRVTPKLSFRNFVSVMQQQGLGAICSAEYDAPTLLRIAEESLTCETQLATGCYLVQAAALVHAWRLHTLRDPEKHKKEACKFGKLGSQRTRHARFRHADRGSSTFLLHHQNRLLMFRFSSSTFSFTQ